MRRQLEPTIALRRLGLPEDCARVVEFWSATYLIMSQASHSVDGGVCLF